MINHGYCRITPISEPLYIQGIKQCPLSNTLLKRQNTKQTKKEQRKANQSSRGDSFKSYFFSYCNILFRRSPAIIIPGMGFDFDERDDGQGEDSSSSSVVLILSNSNGERERPLLLIRSELDDRTRLSVFAEMVVPATGDALTIVPGIGVGGGDGLSERKSG